MKRLMIALALLSASPAAGAIATTNNRATAYATSSVPVAYPSNVTATNLLVACVLIENTTSSVSGITDTRGSAWARAIQFHGSNFTLEIWYAPNVPTTGADTVTVTLSTAIASSVMVEEYSGAATVLPLDQTAAASTSGTASLTSGAKTTAVAGELIVGIAGANSGGFPTAGAGFTRRQTFVNNFYTVNEDGIFSPAGSYAATFTSPGTPDAATAMATFKPPSTGGAPRLTMLGVGP